MASDPRTSSAPGFTGSADPARAVLACAALRRAGQPLPRGLVASAQRAVAPAFGLSPANTLAVDRFTDSAWAVLEGWARRQR